MENRQATRVGRPGDTILNKIEKVAKGENWSVVVECRDFEGKPLADPENVDFIVTIGENERDENPFIELHTWDPQIALLDPAKASFMASFKRSDQILMAEGEQYYINYWTEPKDKSVEGRMLQARDAIRLLPSVEPKFVSSGRLAAVGFPSLLGSTSLTPYEIDPRDGFSGGKAPVGYVSTIDGVTLAIEGTLSLGRDQLVDRDITVTAFDGRGDVRSTIFHQTTYEALSFVGLASVEADRQDGGTVTVALADGWTGGYGGRTYTATAGTISGSNLILPISDAGATIITLTATDEDGKTVPGSLQLTVEEVAPVIVAPTAAGALADLTLTEGVAMEPVDLSGDFTNGGGTLAFALAPTSGALPAGLAMSSVGVLSGTPTATVSGATIVVRATNEAGFADSAFSTTVEAAEDAFQNIEGRVSTGNGQLFAEPTADAEPDEMSLLGFFMAPAAGFGAQVVPWFTSTDGTHEAYIVVTSSGGIYASIYAIVDGVPQTPQIIQSSAHLIQPGQVFALGARGRAGGTFEIYQSIAGAPFVSIGSAQLPAGSVLPFYGEQKVFFGTDIVLEGLYLFDTVPAAFEDLASLNAARSSLMLANGRRAAIDSIKAAVGTPVYAIHGPAATITTNPGTAGGTYPIVGTITDYAPADFSPNVVNIANRSTSLTTATRDPVPYALMYGDLTYLAGGMNGTRFIETKSTGNCMRLTGTGQLQATFDATAAGGTVTNYIVTSPSSYAVTGQVTPFVFEFDGPGGAMRLYAAQANGTLAQVGTTPITVGSTIDLSGDNLTLGKSDKTIETSGLGVYVGASRPAGIDPVAEASKFFGSGGRIADPAITDAYLGLTLIAGKRSQTAAQWASGLNDGVDGPFGVFAGAGSVTDVATAGLAATTISDAAFLGDTYYTTLADDGAAFGNPTLEGRLSLTVDRASVCAGESVYLKINGLTDQEAATWEFVWDLDTSGEFTYLGGLPWHMRQRNRAGGHHQTTAWHPVRDRAGTKTVKVQVIPPVWSGLKGIVLTVDVINRDPATEFGLTAVVSVSNVFTGAPTGTQFTTFQAAMNHIRENGGRIRLKRGETIPYGASTPIDFGTGGSFADGVMIDYWGNDADPMPILDVSANSFNVVRAIQPPFWLNVGIDFRGNYDVATGNGARTDAIRCRENFYLTNHGCLFRNVRTGIESVTPAGEEADTGGIAYYDSRITAWEYYGMYMDTVDFYLVRGCSFDQDPGAVNGFEDKLPGQPGNQPDHGPARLSNAHTVVFSQIRGFSNNGWSDASNSTDGLAIKPRKHQSLIRHGSTTAEGCNSLLNEIWCEGGGFGMNGGSSDRVFGSGFTVVRDCYMQMTANGDGFGLGHSGIWIHSNIISIPNVKQEDTAQPSIFSFDRQSVGVTSTWHTKPFRVFNNTVVYQLSAANHGNFGAVESRDELMTPTFTTDFFTPANGFPAYIEQDNLFWAPNCTLSGETGPLVPSGIYSAGVIGPTPIYQGKRQEQSDGNIWFNAAYATPTDASVLPLLGSVSALLQTADQSLAPAAGFFRGLAELPDPGAISRSVMAEGA